MTNMYCANVLRNNQYVLRNVQNVVRDEQYALRNVHNTDYYQPLWLVLGWDRQPCSCCLPPSLPRESSNVGKLLSIYVSGSGSGIISSIVTDPNLGYGSATLVFWIRNQVFFCSSDLDPDPLVRDSVADPWHFGVDPDPDTRFHASDPDPSVFVIDLQDASKKK